MRILSATHKNLGDLVAQAKFREDLFYRINVIELRVPPLRERAEDIPDLADAIVRTAVAPAGHRCAGDHAGGARRAAELPVSRQRARAGKRARARAGAVQRGTHRRRRSAAARRAAPENAPPPLGDGHRADARACRQHRGRGTQAARALGDQLEDVERAAIVKALEAARYNKTAAAKALGMTFRALRYRIKKLGIE